jgi:hypothetical protein
MLMTQNLKDLLEEVAGWPDADQAELASLARQIRARRIAGVLSGEGRPRIRESRDPSKRDFVSERGMEKFWMRHAG